MEKHKVLDQLLGDLERFLKALDQETLSSNVAVQKCLLSALLQSYLSSDEGDAEYIYMNKVVVGGQSQDKNAVHTEELSAALTNGRTVKHVPAPQKSLPELPLPRTCSLPVVESPEGYYEEAQPYDTANNDDCEVVSSSYESYDEEEVTKGKSAAQHQWPSTEASIELMRDARICAFLWRKKWLGQWAKQLCVIREQRLLCYKSSKEQAPQLDVSLVGCSVVYKEKQVKKKEHKLKVVPLGGEAIVLGLQSKEQAEQWLKVILEISTKPVDLSEMPQCPTDSPRLTKGELGERFSAASESGSSTDSHADSPETKDVKKRYGAGLMLSNLMNMGKKKPSSLESPEKSVDTAGYLNVLVNNQWRARWCLIKQGQLWFYQDKAKTKVAQQPLALEACTVLPDPSPDHLYSFRIQKEGEQLIILEAKSSTDMGHWLGLLLSQSGSKIDPEELSYDYVDQERISSIVNAAKASMYLMQRRYSEPNAYTDSLSSTPNDTDDIYDNVATTDPEQEDSQDSQESGGEQEAGPAEQEAGPAEQKAADRIYLDLTSVRKSFLHPSAGCTSSQPSRDPCLSPLSRGEEEDPPNQVGLPPQPDPRPPHSLMGSKPLIATQRQEPDQSLPKPTQEPQRTTLSTQEPQRTTLSTQEPQRLSLPIQESQRRGVKRSNSPQFTKSNPESPDTARTTAAVCTGSIEVKLGKNRTEADVRRFTDDRDRLEREKEQVRSNLATLRSQRKELKEALSIARDPGQQSTLETRLKETEEACRGEERKRVELELQLMEVKENLRKVEAGPFTLGTAVDSGFLDTSKATTAADRQSDRQTGSTPPTAPANSGDASPVNSATALKTKPLSIMVSNKGNVLQKAKEWEKKATT